MIIPSFRSISISLISFPEKVAVGCGIEDVDDFEGWSHCTKLDGVSQAAVEPLTGLS
jgi:hypothetical protein